MEWEVLKIYSDVIDAYEDVRFDGYQLYGFQDGYLGDDEGLLEEQFVNLAEYANSVELHEALSNKLEKYEGTNWEGVSDSVEFGNHMRQRIEECGTLITIINGENDE